MKKSLLILLIGVLFFLSGCGASAPEATSVTSTHAEAGAERLTLHVNGQDFTVLMEDNEAAHALVEMLPITLDMSDYSGFEKVGALGKSLPTSNRQMTTNSGDLVLYNGNQLVVFYGSNTWSYTKLGHLDDITGWAEALGDGDVTITLERAE